MAKQSQQITLLSDASVGQLLQGSRDNFTSIVERSRIQGIINWQKESALAKQIVGKDTRLQQATPESIQNAFMNVAFTGLSLNPVKQHATFLARWNDKIKRYEASLMIMYRGLMWLAGQAGVTDISVDVVYTADKARFWKTDEGDKYEHELAVGVPRDGIANKFVCVYVAATMPGSKKRKLEVIYAEDIYKARDKSDSYLDRETGQPHPKSPWTWAFDEMAKKVGIKRAQKRWEEAVIENDDWKRFQTAVALDNANEGVIPARADDIPGTAEHVKGQEQKEQAEQKLSMAQLTEIEKLASQVAPNSDRFPTNTAGYMAKIARTYRCNALDEVAATKFNEIKDRINEAITREKNKKATTGKGSTEKKDEGAPASSGKAEGAGSKAAKEGGQQEREPGSDDEGPGADSGRQAGDPGPTSG